MTPENASTTPLKPLLLSPADLAVCANVAGRLASGEIDARTALRWLLGWVETPVAADAREGVGGDRDNEVTVCPDHGCRTEP